MMVQKYKKEIINIIHKYLPNAKIYLFGSRARKTHSQGADIDLALDSGEKIEFLTLFKIKEEIEETNLPLFVDLVDINDSDKEFIEEISKDWILWEN